MAKNITFNDLSRMCDWVVKTEIVEISPLCKKTIRLPNGEMWFETYREYTLEIRASFPREDSGKLLLHGASVYTDSTGNKLITLWNQTEWDGLLLQIGQSLWLYSNEKALSQTPFYGFPEDSLILVSDTLGRLMPCRAVSRLVQTDT